MTLQLAPIISLFCPECNIQTDAKIMATAIGPLSEDERFDGDDPYNARQHEIAFCGRCGNPFLLERELYILPTEGTDHTTGCQVLYPSDRQVLQDGLPLIVAHPYEQAVRAFRAALYEPCVIMCRKCLEAICLEHNANGRNLAQQLADLKDRELIDNRLAQWANQLRVVGNDAAHDHSATITIDDARDTLDFAEAICTYIFTLNAKFEAFVNRRNARRST